MSEITRRGVDLGVLAGSLWWLGWHPLVALVVGWFAGLAVGNALAIPVLALLGVHPLATMGGLAVLGSLVGVAGWYRGTRAVNARYRTLLDAHRGGVRLPGTDAVAFALIGTGSGSTPLVEPPPGYDARFVVLRDESMAVQPGTLDLAERRPDLDLHDDAAVAVPYDQIESVEYGGTSLVVHTTRGDDLRYESDREPAALMDALGDRARGSA